MQCPNCGGKMEGDGYTIVRHCERVDAPNDVESDAPPIYCSEPLYESHITTKESHDANDTWIDNACFWN